MAIKDKKIPSHSEVNTSSQSFDEKELKQLRDLRTKLDRITYQLGQLFINKNKLQETEIQLSNELKELESEEATLAEFLTRKYGKGSIDIETGTFTPSE